jgi:hypothetical protein
MRVRFLIYAGILLAITVGVFLFSHSRWQIYSSEISRVTLFFPEQRTADLYPEFRAIKASLNHEASIRNLLDLLLAGPQTMTFKRISPPGTQVKNVFIRNGIVYVSLSELFQANDDLSSKIISDRMHLIEMAIKYNYPKYKKVVFVVDNVEVLSYSQL